MDIVPIVFYVLDEVFTKKRYQGVVRNKTQQCDNIGKQGIRLQFRVMTQCFGAKADLWMQNGIIYAPVMRTRIPKDRKTVKPVANGFRIKMGIACFIHIF